MLINGGCRERDSAYAKLYRCPLETGIDNDLMILLSANQRNLRFLRLGPLTDNAFNIPGSLLPWPPTIHTLVIPWKINAAVDIDFYQQLIERSAKTLKALTVRTQNFSGADDQFPPDEWRGSFRFAKALFKHFRGLNRQPELELDDLNLQNQDLLSAPGTWRWYIDFTKLRTLQLWNCELADGLLLHLIRLAKEQSLRLHGVVLSFEHSRQAPTKAQTFVGSIAGLQYLNLCYTPHETEKQTFDLRCLIPHRDSIKDLYIGVGANNQSLQFHHVLSSDDLTWLSSNCLKLVQLGIALPPFRMDDAFAGRWGECGSALVKLPPFAGRSQRVLTNVQEKLASLPRLKILRILTWPIMCDPAFTRMGECGLRRSQQKLYLKQLDTIATSIARLFASLRSDHHDRLSVITFGSAESWDVVYDAEDNQSHIFSAPVTYKVRRKETEFGLVTRAKRIDAHLMEHEEPIAYVVDEDIDQGLSLEGYSWGSGY